jgi:hypothetical protein
MTTSLNHPSEETLLSELELAREQVSIGAIYVHSRTRTPYKVIDVTIEKPIQEVAILYQKAFDPFDTIVWIRPISTFLEKVRVGNYLVPRFQKNTR